jgi:hypothetical protein
MIGEDPSGIPNNLMPYVAQVRDRHIAVQSSQWRRQAGISRVAFAVCVRVCVVGGRGAPCPADRLRR